MPQTNTSAFTPNDGDVLAVDTRALGAMFGAFDVARPLFETDGDDAVLTLRGPLAHHAGWFDSYDAIRSRFDAAMKSEAKRVVMRIDSPGGYVSGCFELARHMRKAADDSGKKLVAQIEGQATSAAYALACAADEIVASPTGMVGSIGVIRVATDMSKMAEGAGIRFHVLTSGERKSDGHPFKEASEAALKAMQAEVDELAEVFFAWVAERRTMSVKDVEDLEAGVRIGESALSAGLVDRIDPLGSSKPTASPMVGEDDTGDAAASPKEKSTMDKAIMQALGCAEDATEAAVLASATKISGERGALLAVIGVETLEEAKGAVEAWKADKAALQAAQAELATVRALAAEKERSELLAKAATMFSPAKMETLKDESSDFVRKFTQMATPDIRADLPAEAKTGRVLTASQKKAAASAGMTEAEFAAELDQVGGEQ